MVNFTRGAWFATFIGCISFISVLKWLRVAHFFRPQERLYFSHWAPSNVSVAKETYFPIKCLGNKAIDRSCIFTDAHFEIDSNTIDIIVDPIYGLTFSQTLTALGVPLFCAKGCAFFLPASSPARMKRREKLWQISINKHRRQIDNTCHKNYDVVLWKQHRHNNFGHVLTDNLFPLFTLQINLDGYKFNRELILVNDCRSEKIWTNKSIQNCQNMQHMYGSLFYKVSYLRDLQKVCSNFVFRRLYIGGGGYGIHFYGTYHGKQLATELKYDSTAAHMDSELLGSKGIGHYVAQLKQTIARNYGIKYKATSGSSPLVVIADKKISNNIDTLMGLRSIHDIDSIAKELGEIFICVRIMKSDFLMSLKEQIALLKDVDVLISPFGGISFAATFLPQGATLISITLPHGGIPLLHGTDDLDSDYYWKYLSHLNILRYKVESFEELVINDNSNLKKAKRDFLYCKDYEESSGRQCDRYNQALHTADYRLDIKKISALLHYSLKDDLKCTTRIKRKSPFSLFHREKEMTGF